MALLDDYTPGQAATILADVYAQATGKEAIAPVNTAEFVSMGQTLLKAGYNSIYNGMIQVWQRPIYSIRALRSGRFSRMIKEAAQYGNPRAKYSPLDRPALRDTSVDANDDTSRSPWAASNQQVMSQVFTGNTGWQRSLKMPVTQLRDSLRGPDEFMQYNAMMITNLNNLLTKDREELARNTLNNFIAAKEIADDRNVINALEVYNDVTGLDLTAQTVRQPDNYAPFMRWLYGYLNELAARMEEYSSQYHFNFTNKGGEFSGGAWTGGVDWTVNRTTPLDRLSVYIFGGERYAMEAQVLATTYHDSYLSRSYTETVNYWQSIQTPDVIEITPVYPLPNGELDETEGPVELEGLFAVLIDDEAVGINLVESSLMATEVHPREHFSVLWATERWRFYNDLTENAIVVRIA